MQCEKCGSRATHLKFEHLPKEEVTGRKNPVKTYKVCGECGHTKNVTKPKK